MTPELGFGTDGIRGVANRELTAELAVRLGRSAVRVLGGGRWLIGRDTRRSGPMLESALAAGLASEGADVELLGVAPTPAVAALSAQADCPAAMISASHNPFADNGIKLFAAGGRKLTDELEAGIVAADREDPGQPATGGDVGTVQTSNRSLAPWLDPIRSVLEGRMLRGLRVVVDAANGANAEIAPDFLTGLGLEVETIGAEPDGVNINDGVGSNHPEALSQRVRTAGADLGVAFDGDADRVVAVSGSGRVIDGDHLMAMLALDLHRRELLTHDTVVVTVMTNLGFRRAMDERGISIVETQVGDRYVLEAMERGDFMLGGEQSGHVIFRDVASTGDGLLTAVRVLDLVVRTGTDLDRLAAASMTSVPQLLENVPIRERDPAIVERLQPKIDEVSGRLGTDGRVLVRPSGTEPVVRVMVEAVAADSARAALDELVAAVEAASGAGES